MLLGTDGAFGFLCNRRVVNSAQNGIAVVNISLITDYDCGLIALGEIPPVSQEEVYAVFAKNATRIKSVVMELIRRIPTDLNSPCHHALESAVVGG